MGLILNIETSTTNCSVSLAKGGEVLFFKETAEGGYSHGEKLHGFIDEVFKETNMSPNSVDAIAVVKVLVRILDSELVSQQLRDYVML